VIPANISPEQESPMRRFIQTSRLRRFLPAQEGATAIEYAIIAAGIAGVIITTVTALGGSVTGMFTAVSNLLH
jgi:pilus assembly protein Flp/PilA